MNTAPGASRARAPPMQDRSRPMRLRLACVCLVLLALPAVAAAPDHGREYAACMTLTERNAVEAFESALAWADQGGGDAAQHCAAVALLRQGKADAAALRMETVARDSRSATAEIRAGLLVQAAHAWIEAGQLGRADTALTQALKLVPDDGQILTDRGSVRGQLRRFGEAIQDLNGALVADPRNVDALVYRASALRQIGRIPEARADIETAVRLDPRSGDALFERGLLRQAGGDLPGARQDFLAAVLSAPGTPAADAAQRAIEQLALPK